MTPDEARILRAGAARLGIDLEPEAVTRLTRFLAIFGEWNRRTRLTAERTLSRVIEQHVVDSLAPVPLLPPMGLLADIGSGAGFPGIVLGCVRPDIDLVLIESRRRRASFLREAIRSIPLPRARALEVRAEEAAEESLLAGHVDVAIARALRLDISLTLAAPLLAAHGMLIAMQTPRTAAAADRVRAPRDLRFVGRRDYSLTTGAERTLLIFGWGAEAVP